MESLSKKEILDKFSKNLKNKKESTRKNYLVHAGKYLDWMIDNRLEFLESQNLETYSKKSGQTVLILLNQLAFLKKFSLKLPQKEIQEYFKEFYADIQTLLLSKRTVNEYKMYLRLYESFLYENDLELGITSVLGYIRFLKKEEKQDFFKDKYSYAISKFYKTIYKQQYNGYLKIEGINILNDLKLSLLVN